MVKQKKSRGPTPKAEDRTWHKAYRKPSSGSSSTRGGGSRAGASYGRRDARSSDAKKRNDSIIYGVNPVYEYLKAGIPAQKLIISSGLTPDSRIQEIIQTANQAELPIYELPKPQLDTITNFGVHQGIVLYSNDYDYADVHDLIADGKKIVILDHITDPHNLGAIIRSCAAFGANIIIPNARTATVNATVWKTSAGNAAKIQVAKVSNLNNAIASIQKAGYYVVGLDGSAEYDLTDPQVQDNKLLCFVAGNEGSGISALVKKNCDALAKIPTAVESLNVSSACAIALYSCSPKGS